MVEATISEHLDFVRYMVSKGGPDETEYAKIDDWLATVHEQWKSGELSDDDIERIRSAFGDALSLKTTQGFGFKKPHGYPGDYEMIDKIYQKEFSADLNLRNWDVYGHASDGPCAVRNRKRYFLNLLETLNQSYAEQDAIHVLNVGSGPSRDIFEYFSSFQDRNRIKVACIDHDENAVEYSKLLCSAYLSNLTFYCQNIFKFKAERPYQLIWSAGLFDYITDKQFVFLLKSLLNMLDSKNGELVIGNFSDKNNARNYMEVMLDWHLHHRSPKQLMSLATRAEIEAHDIRIGREPRGVNLFLHVKRGENFIELDFTDGTGSHGSVLMSK